MSTLYFIFDHSNKVAGPVTTKDLIEILAQVNNMQEYQIGQTEINFNANLLGHADYPYIFNGKQIIKNSRYNEVYELQKQCANTIRKHRDFLIEKVLWLVERHKQQKLLNIKSTLSEKEFLLLLQYIEDLRNVPQQEGFPWDGNIANPFIKWPKKLNFIKE